MSLLSFVITISAALFDRAIFTPNKLNQIISGNSKGYSAMEKEILSARTKTIVPSNLYQTGITVKISGVEFRNIKGSLISYDGSTIKKDDDVRAEDNYITFVSSVHRETPTSTVEELYIDSPSRFVYHPIRNSKFDVPVYYEVKNPRDPSNPARLLQAFKKLRARYLRAPVSNLQNTAIYTPFVDEYVVMVDNSTLTESNFDYLDEAVDSADSSFTGTVKMPIPDYQTDPQKYLDSIDKSYATDATTLNSSGHIGKQKNTFSNTQADKNNVVHVIGLPILKIIKSDSTSEDVLLAHYDYNLLISQSNTAAEKNKYYSLYDLTKANLTKYSGANAIVKPDNSVYSLEWGKSDVRKITGISNDEVSETVMKVSKGYLPKLTYKISESVFSDEGIPLSTTETTMDAPYARKSYGHSAYYASLNSIAEFSAKEDKYTFFVKINLENYNEFGEKKSEISPVTLLLSNWNRTTGQVKPGPNGGFAIFADKDGELYINSTADNKKINYNIKTAPSLYKDKAGAFKFNKLGYINQMPTTKRDDRENFLIMAFTIEKSGRNNKLINMYVLESEKYDVTEGGKTNSYIRTKVKHLGLFKINSFSDNSKFEFGGPLSKGISGTSQIDMTDPMAGRGFVEVSDMILYKGNLKAERLNNSNYLEYTMEYLYRKYLTENERKAGKYDNYLVDKYKP